MFEVCIRQNQNAKLLKQSGNDYHCKKREKKSFQGTKNKHAHIIYDGIMMLFCTGMNTGVPWTLKVLS